MKECQTSISYNLVNISCTADQKKESPSPPGGRGSNNVHHYLLSLNITSIESTQPNRNIFLLDLEFCLWSSRRRNRRIERESLKIYHQVQNIFCTNILSLYTAIFFQTVEKKVFIDIFREQVYLENDLKL